MGKHPEIDLSRVRTRPLAERESLVSVDQFVDTGALAAGPDPLAAFPDVLAGREIRRLADHLARASTERRRVLVMMGGHVVKTGVTPCFVALARAGAVTAFAGNGSVAIHDVEIALSGRTSERVEAGLGTGDFGVATETAAFLNEAARAAADRGEGLGEAIGRLLVAAAPRHVDASLLAFAHAEGIPFTLHVAIGADVVHQHPGCDGRALGEATLRDFRILAAHLTEIDGGVVVNVGSAVIMPEVFLKALNVARNLGHPSPSLVTANLDFLQHYRPRQNVLQRPTREGGEAIALTGHHEILVPLLTKGVLARL